MTSLLGFVFDILEYVLSWRLFVALAVAGAMIYLVVLYVPNESAQGAISIALGVIGFSGGMYWQCRAENRQ
jgi:hypothetical protein